MSSVPADDGRVSDLLLHTGPAAEAGEDLQRFLTGDVVSLAEVQRWCESGRLYTLRSVLDPEPPAAAAVVLVAPAAWSAELRSVMVRPDLRGLGLSRRMLLGIADDLRGLGHQLLVTAVHSTRLGWAVPLRQVGFVPVAETLRARGDGPADDDPRAGGARWLALAL